eukprot:7327465-Lingulodinium_polyedra.AAC.1
MPEHAAAPLGHQGHCKGKGLACQVVLSDHPGQLACGLGPQARELGGEPYKTKGVLVLQQGAKLPERARPLSLGSSQVEAEAGLRAPDLGRMAGVVIQQGPAESLDEAHQILQAVAAQDHTGCHQG